MKILNENVILFTESYVCVFIKKVNTEDIPQLCMHGNHIDRVLTFKSLGVFVISDLSWDTVLCICFKKLLY